MEFEFHWLWGIAFSLGGLTVLFPLLAVLVASCSRRAARSLPPALAPIRLEILIPAYNEADTLGRTLTSVWAAAQRLKEKDPEASVTITVGLDGPRDATPAIAAAFAARARHSVVEVKVLDRGRNRGKWQTVSELAAQSTGFWSALVDSGTLWPEDFLLRIRERLLESDGVGIAPGYAHEAGILTRLVWWQERMLKSLENFAGGPCSLHGATMIFRTRELQEAIVALGSRAWLNDDVVLGLALRRKGRIDYLGAALCVSDCGVRDGGNELSRRRRMLAGNIEWIQALLAETFVEAPAVGFLALRRVMRVLWAYHLAFGVFCLVRLTGAPAYQAVSWIGLLAAIAASRKGIREAGWVSLSAPVLIFRRNARILWA